MESSKSGYWGLKNVTLLADLNVKLSDGKTMTGKAGSVAMNPKMVGIDSVRMRYLTMKLKITVADSL